MKNCSFIRQSCPSDDAAPRSLDLHFKITPKTITVCVSVKA